MFRFILNFLFFLTFLRSVHSFCIYNQHSDPTVINIFQTGGQSTFTPDSSRFHAPELSPGDKQCCHFSNPQCNGTRKPENTLSFGVRRKYPDRREGIFDIDCPAGGFIVFSGDSNQPNIEVFNADRSPYNFHFSWRPSDRQFSVHHDKSNATASTNHQPLNNTGTSA